MSETKAIVSPTLELLKAAGILCWRNNSGRRARVQFGLGTGSADIIGILSDGRFFALEAKLPKGKLTGEQVAWGNAVLRANGFWAVIHSPEAAISLVRLWQQWDSADRRTA